MDKLLITVREIKGTCTAFGNGFDEGTVVSVFQRCSFYGQGRQEYRLLAPSPWPHCRSLHNRTRVSKTEPISMVSLKTAATLEPERGSPLFR